jgi:outer membrane protein assembly factor BamA
LYLNLRLTNGLLFLFRSVLRIFLPFLFYLSWQGFSAYSTHMKFVIRVAFALFILSGYSATLTAQLFRFLDTAETNEYSKKRISPMIYYSNPDKVFVGVKFRLAKVTLQNDPDGYPYGFDQSIQLRYSISQNAFSIMYDGRFYQALGHWNVFVNGDYDWMIWTNFFGLGNDTRKVNDLTYYRLSTGEYAGDIGIDRIFADHNYVNLDVNVQGIEVFNKRGTFVSDSFINDNAYYFEHHIYTSLRANYTYQNVNDPNVPTRGIMFYAGGGYTVNVSETNKSFASYNGILQLFIPLISKFSLALKTGGSGISGNPEFYQYVSVGGPMTIRGYLRDRFWGDFAFYNTNELRYITDFDIHFLRGKIGLLALYDNGRVWMNNENSTTLHSGYGGGLLLAPFNKFTGVLSYAVSPEGGIVQVRISKLLANTKNNQLPTHR